MVCMYPHLNWGVPSCNFRYITSTSTAEPVTTAGDIVGKRIHMSLFKQTLDVNFIDEYSI